MLSVQDVKEFVSSLPKDPDWVKQRSKPSFRGKQQMVKNFWLVSGLVMLGSQNIYAIAALAIFTTIISFMVLYETE